MIPDFTHGRRIATQQPVLNILKDTCAHLPMGTTAAPLLNLSARAGLGIFFRHANLHSMGVNTT